MDNGIRSLSLSETQLGAVIERWLAEEVLKHRQPVVGLDWCDGFLSVELGPAVDEEAAPEASVTAVTPAAIRVLPDARQRVQTAPDEGIVALQRREAGERGAYRVSDEQMAEIRRLSFLRCNAAEIAERVGLGESTVHRKLKLIKDEMRAQLLAAEEQAKRDAEAVHVAEPTAAPFPAGTLPSNGSNGTGTH